MHHLKLVIDPRHRRTALVRASGELGIAACAVLREAARRRRHVIVDLRRAVLVGADAAMVITTHALRLTAAGRTLATVMTEHAGVTGAARPAPLALLPVYRTVADARAATDHHDAARSAAPRRPAHPAPPRPLRPLPVPVSCRPDASP